MISLPRFHNGTLEALKWLALALMVLDHVDAFVYHRELTWACALGRLVFPIFAFILGYHLSRPRALAAGVYGRVALRLLAFGAIAQVPHGLLTHASLGLFPLNIFATFAVAVGVIALLDRGERLLALALFLAGGAVVEYQCPGVALCVAVWAAYRRPSIFSVAVLGYAWASLELINGSYLALWALPLLALASGLQLAVPRLRWAFYGFYPAHLLAFVLLGLAM